MPLLDPMLGLVEALGGFASLLLLPVVAGSAYSLLCLAAVALFVSRRAKPAIALPPVTILKPVCGLEKGLEENLRSACLQDYPEFQVVLSVQDPQDPALAVIRRVAAEFGSDRVSVVIADGVAAANGKIHNLVSAIRAARHELIAMSDSDVHLEPDFLRTIVAPLEDPGVGFACTMYRATGAVAWYEKLEQLSLHDFTVNVVFAVLTGASHFCLGSSIVMRRKDLEAIGGLAPLEDYLVEDYELGSRIRALGLRGVLVNYTVDTVVDLEGPSSWWDHQLYWDKNTRFARPKGFFFHVLVRAVPFALAIAALRLFDPLGLGILGAALALRLATSAGILALLRDSEGLRNLPWLPLRDLSAFVTWVLALRRGPVVWRGVEFDLTPEGRMVRREDDLDLAPAANES